MADYAFHAALERIMASGGVRTQTGLASFLGVSQSSVWDAKTRAEGIPAGWLVTLVERYGISPRWVKTGEGPQYLAVALEHVPTLELLAEVGRRMDGLMQKQEQKHDSA
jgi:hypothetical protein